MEAPGLQTVTRATFWSGLERMANRLVTLGVFVVLGRLLAPEHFGLVALAGIFTSFMQVLVDQGLSKAVIQRETLGRGQLDTAFWTAVATGTALTVLGVLGAPLVSRVLGEPELTAVVRWLSVGFLLSSLTATQQALLQRHFAFRSLAARNLSATLAGGLVGIVLAASGAGVWSLVAQALARSVVGTGVLWAASPWRPGLQVSRRDFNELFGFGLRVVGVDFLGFLTRHGDNLFVGAFLGPVALGYYTVAYRVLGVMTELFLGTVNHVAVPTFSRLQADPQATRRAFYAAIRLTQAIALPAFVGVAVLAPEIVAVLFGPRWAASAPVLQALALVGMLHSATYFDRSILFAAGRPGLEFRIELVATIGNLVAFAVAVRWGIVAVAAALAVRHFVLWPVRLVVLHRVAGISPGPYLRLWVRPVIVSGVMAGAMRAIQVVADDALAAPLPLAATIVGGALIYLAALALLAKDITRQLIAALRSLRLPGKQAAA